MTSANRRPGEQTPYPEDWERVAELKVFRAGTEDWDRLASWSADMRRLGWKLLRVSTDGGELVAVFGRSRDGRRG